MTYAPGPSAAIERSSRLSTFLTTPEMSTSGGFRASSLAMVTIATQTGANSPACRSGRIALYNRPTSFARLRYRFFDSSLTRIFSTASFSRATR